MKTLPITPEEIGARRQKDMPNEVIEAFNFFIAKNWSVSSSVVKQSDVIGKILSLMGREPDETRFIFDNNLLNIEEIYIGYGWEVSYDKPGYNETYPATFTFTKGE